MADLASGVSSKGTPKAGGAAGEGTGIEGSKEKAGVHTADSGHSPPAAENLLNRKCSAGGPGEKLASGITYLKTGGGLPYLTVIPDLWDRSVIGRAFSEDGEAGHVRDALMTARTNREPKRGLLFHSDRGVRYCGKEFRDAPPARRPQAGPSMSRKGNRRDKARAERFFKTLKAEADKAEGRQTKEEGRVAVCEYREPYYNKRRRHSALGYAIPTALTPCNTAYPTVHLIEGIPTLPREGKTLPR